jgi:hypothetical protein
MKKGFLALLAGLAVLCLAVPDAAYAFGVEPSRIELSISPGKQKGATVSINNVRSPEAIHIRIYAQDIMFLPDGTNDFLEAGSTEWSCSRWIKAVPEEIDIPAGHTATIRVSVAVPEGAKGGYYSMLFFESGMVSPEGLGINFRIGALVDISVPNTEQQQAKLTNLAFDPSGEIAVDIFNEGNVLIRPKGKIRLLDARGKRVKQIEFNPNRLGILPKTLRKFSDRLENLPSRGKYTLKAEIDYGTKYLLVGELPIEID